MLVPAGTASRVPIACVTGSNGKTTTARMLAHITKMAGYTPGLTITDSVRIDGQRTRYVFCRSSRCCRYSSRLISRRA